MIAKHSFDHSETNTKSYFRLTVTYILCLSLEIRFKQRF